MTPPHLRDARRAGRPGPTAPCPCGRVGGPDPGATYGACCGRFIDDFANCPAPDPERLMRSRYTAFATGAGEYLLATWHASRRPRDVSFPGGMKWLGLKILAASGAEADRAEVEFVARFSANGRAGRLHETSTFVREDGRWYYVDGTLR